MSREEIEKLLGGYATDTLDEAERRALFEAALDDQEIFDALAKEQALKEVLHSGEARAQLLAALGPAREGFGARAWGWLRRPAVLAMAGGLAVLSIVVGVALRDSRQEVGLHRPMMAEVREPERMMAPTAPAAPAKGLPAPAPPLRRQQQLSDAENRPKDTLNAVTAERAQEAAPLPQPPALSSRDDFAAATPPPPPAPPPPQVTPPPTAVPQAVAGRVRGEAFEARSLAGGEMKLAKNKAAKRVAPAAKYTLLLRGADGAYAPADGTVFRVGDAVRIQAEAHATGRLYLLRKDAAGAWNPVADVAAVEGQSYVMPQSGGVESGTPGSVELLLRIEPGGATPVRIAIEFR